MQHPTAQLLRTRTADLYASLSKYQQNPRTSVPRNLTRFGILYTVGTLLWLLSPAALLAVATTLTIREILVVVGFSREARFFAKADLLVISEQERENIKAIWLWRSIAASNRAQNALALSLGGGLVPVLSFFVGNFAEQPIIPIQLANQGCTLVSLGISVAGSLGLWPKPLIAKLTPSRA